MQHILFILKTVGFKTTYILPWDPDHQIMTMKLNKSMWLWIHVCMFMHVHQWQLKSTRKYQTHLPHPPTTHTHILKKYFSEAAQLGTAATWKTRQRLTLKMELVGENYNTKQMKVINCPVLVNSSEMVYVIRRQRPLLKCCGINWKLWSKTVNYTSNVLYLFSSYSICFVASHNALQMHENQAKLTE